MAFQPEGIITALITPFRDDESLDETTLAVRLDEQVAAEVQGIMVRGVSGKYVDLTRRAGASGPRVQGAGARACPVVAGILEPNARAAVQAALRAEEAGADALRGTRHHREL